MPLAIVVAASMMVISPAAVAQASVTQHSTCTADVQGLMCNPGDRVLEAPTVNESSVGAPVPQAATKTASVLQPLSNTQMERLADILLGLTYFVLPVGLGVGLFLYDRHQAQRTATLEAQIKLLEKLWHQSPQA
ncbi:MAG: hypothetical protein H7Z11_09835 [Verrucomicrobia bacterium]|nr:hypothetical protein [Leptolyngbya sp. ES-bin-22]